MNLDVLPWNDQVSRFIRVFYPEAAHRGLEQPKKFTNLRVKKDECLENQKCYLDPK